MKWPATRDKRTTKASVAKKSYISKSAPYGAKKGLPHYPSARLSSPPIECMNIQAKPSFLKLGNVVGIRPWTYLRKTGQLHTRTFKSTNKKPRVVKPYTPDGVRRTP